MKNNLLLLITTFLLFSCKKNTETVLVKNIDELNQAIIEAAAGTEIILRAETAGEVFLEGQSSLSLGGEYLVAKDLYFRNGYSRNRDGIIRYRISSDSIAFHSRVTGCVIEDFTKPNRWDRDGWVAFYGKHNQIDHCYISGKSNDGATLMVYHKGNEHTNSHHQIINNYFGPRPRKGGPRAETMRLGGSETSMTSGYVNVSNNFFDACNGEVEIISDKTRNNIYKDNIFYKSEGSLVMRHSDYTIVDGNIFIGDDDSDFYGGIRVVNTGHWITNNYLYKIRGEEFRSPLAIMNGIPKSSLNRYKQVTDIVVAHNTWVDCKSPFQIGVGQNKASVNVLPKSEIRSAPPIRSIIANNLVYNTKADTAPIVNHDDMSGVLFKNNVLDNNGIEYTKYDIFQNGAVKMKQVNNWLYVPEDENPALNEVYAGYDFERINQDIFGVSRNAINKVGAISQLSAAQNYQIDKSQYGPSWFNPNKEKAQPNIHSASEGELAKIIAEAKSGDIIELMDAAYTIDASLKINKDITLRSTGENKAVLIFTGTENTPLFKMNPKGTIRIKNISIKGQKTQLAFAPLDISMASAYKVFVENSDIDGFGYVLKASRGSFADSLHFKNITIQNCENGFVLAADEKGDYNAEMVTFKKCTFNNIQQNVIHFYRGGYDESTIGGFLKLSNNTFTNCGRKEKSGVLLKTRGIINVHIFDNTFTDNPIQSVAILWGIKNNHHRNNTLTQSGQIKVEEQQKLDILY